MNSVLFRIYPLWDYINLGVYNFLPFILMVILNSGVIYHLIYLRRTTTVQNSRIQHRAISIPLVIMTFLFLIMTVPATVAFRFFSNANSTILRLLDCILYSYHILSFPLYMITFDEFRQEFIALITCKKDQSNSWIFDCYVTTVITNEVNDCILKNMSASLPIIIVERTI